MAPDWSWNQHQALALMKGLVLVGLQWGKMLDGGCHSQFASQVLSATDPSQI